MYLWQKAGGLDREEAIGPGEGLNGEGRMWPEGGLISPGKGSYESPAGRHTTHWAGG